MTKVRLQCEHQESKQAQNKEGRGKEKPRKTAAEESRYAVMQNMDVATSLELDGLGRQTEMLTVEIIDLVPLLTKGISLGMSSR